MGGIQYFNPNFKTSFSSLLKTLSEKLKITLSASIQDPKATPRSINFLACVSFTLLILEPLPLQILDNNTLKSNQVTDDLKSHKNLPYCSLCRLKAFCFVLIS